MEDIDDEAFGEVEDDDAIITHISLRYFGRNSSRRVSINIEIPDPPSTSRWIIELGPPPSNFVMILDDRDVADDEDAGVEEETEDIVKIFPSNTHWEAPSPPPVPLA